VGAAAWDVESFRAAARALGRFHAAFLCGRPLPDEPWLNNDYLPGFLAYARPSVDRLLRLARHGPTEYRGLLRGGDTSGVAAVVALVERPEPVLAALTRVPQVLCHLDTHVGNLVLRPDLRRGPEPRLVAVDWQLVGRGPLGADLAQLVSGGPSVPAASSTRDEPAAARRESAVLEAYGDALARAGATVDPAVVRFGHAACAVLRQGCWELFLLALDVHRRRRLPDVDGSGAASERAEGTRRLVEEVVDRIETSRLPALAVRVQDLLPMVERAG
jgi:hypothetical protein